MSAQAEPAVFDPAAVARLTGDVHDPTAARGLLDRYRWLLPTRVSRIAVALDAPDLDVAMDAALSLRASSGMFGTGELHDLGDRIVRALRGADLVAARAATDELSGAVERAHRALAAYLDD